MKIQYGSSIAKKTREIGAGPPPTAKPKPDVTAERTEVKAGESVTSESKQAALNAEKIRQSVEALNKAVEVVLPNRLKFRVHEATDQIQVQIIDQESNKVVKEIPPQEILDLMTRIKEMVGWFLDERI